MSSICTSLFQYFCIAVALLIPVIWQLYTTSPYCRFRLKMFLYGLMIMVESFLCIIFSLPDPFNPDNCRKVGGWLMFDVMKFHKIFGIHMEKRGLENFDLDGPFLVVCNHQSSLDLIPMFTTQPRRCTAMGKQELLYAGPFGIAALLCGGYFVDRRPGKARETMARIARDIKEKNVRLWMFAEGTRNHGEGMLPFKKGAFHLAIQAGVPVIPVVISSYKSYYDKSINKFEDGKMIITVLPAVSSNPYTTETVQNYADDVRAIMLKKFDETSAEVAAEAAGAKKQN